MSWISPSIKAYTKFQSIDRDKYDLAKKYPPWASLLWHRYLSLTRRWSRSIWNEKQPRNWALRRINCRLFYYHSPNCKERKKRFDKEEEYEENGFILIHLVGKKMGLKENKEKKMVWKRRRGLGRWLYSHSLSCK